MKKPAGIIFDLGNTLIERSFYSPANGFAAIMKHSATNTSISPEQIEIAADETHLLLHDTKEKYNVEFKCPGISPYYFR